MSQHTDIRTAREIVADEIDRLISYLDSIDTDPDLEETGDLEPSLGAYVGSPDLERDDADYDANLGSLDRMVDQTRWAGGGTDDAELDRSDYEDGEAGWSNPMGAEVDARMRLVAEHVRDRQVRR